MSKPEFSYLLEGKKTESGFHFFFVSEGKQNIIKIIQYTFVQVLNGKNVYNLGFGDYNLGTDSINDRVESNNGDHYKVFNTVLNSVPIFFKTYPNAILMVEGSDSSSDFINSCMLSCIRDCTEKCRKSKRRINIYKLYVDKNFEKLNSEYEFIGGVWDPQNHVTTEFYCPGKNYDIVQLSKRN